MKISDMLQNVRSLESTPEDEMRQYILSLANELNLNEGHVLPMNVLFHRTINLNPKQREALEPAINKLIEEGIFEERDGNAFLTAKGKDVLY